MDSGIILAIFGALLTIIVGLMGWQSLAIIGAGKSIAVLDSLLKEISNDLKDISEELKKIGQHDSSIAVLNNEVENLKADTTLLFEKVRELERHETTSLHRRQ